VLSESARPVGLVRAPGALSLSSISNCNIYRIHKAPPPQAMPILIPVSSERFRPPDYAKRLVPIRSSTMGPRTAIHQDQ